MVQALLTLAIWAFSLLVAIPLTRAWWLYTGRREGQVHGSSVLALALVTGSYLWLLALLFFSNVTGPHYSDLRFTTIYVNLAAGTVAVGLTLAFARNGRFIRPVAVWVTALWLYLLAVSSVA